MVCDRCVRVVREELERAGFKVEQVSLGEAILRSPKGPVDLQRIETILSENGFELIKDKNAKLIEQIKQNIISLVHGDPEERREKLSQYLSRALGTDYHKLSALFSSVENITIEQYVILHKIERAKELLKYGELTLSEIAYRMGYSSVQHLSNQFKKITGLTPSHFRRLRKATRRPIDKIS